MLRLFYNLFSKRCKKLTYPNQPGRGGGGQGEYLALYLVSNSSKSHAKNVSGINILIFFKKWNWFLQCQHFFTTKCYFFLCVFCWNNEYFPDNISPIWVKKVCEKNLYWLFFNNTFPIGKISVNLFHYICGIFIKILNFFQ